MGEFQSNVSISGKDAKSPQGGNGDEIKLTLLHMLDTFTWAWSTPYWDWYIWSKGLIWFSLFHELVPSHLQLFFIIDLSTFSIAPYGIIKSNGLNFPLSSVMHLIYGLHRAPLCSILTGSTPGWTKDHGRNLNGELVICKDICILLVS